MASIYKRGNVWWIHYLIAGKSVSKSLRTTNERVAREKKRQLEALDVTGQLLRPSKTPIEPFLQSFCEYLLATCTRKGAKNDISYLRSFFGPCCPALELGSRVPHKFRDTERPLPTVPDTLGKRHVPIRRLEQVSAEIISTFIRNRVVEDKVAPKTANRTREVLHRMFSYAIEHHGYVCPDRRYRNPVEGVKRMREPAPMITWLTRDDIERQLEILVDRPMLRAMVATYIYAGLRREEALWLTTDDVDLSARIIHVRAKRVGGDFWQPKTKRNRSVPVSGDLLGFLRSYQSTGQGVWFFPGPSGGRWDPDDFSSRLREINRATGLSWSCLDFRHTFGSHLAQKGESLYKIAELMGNSPGICRRHYAALVPEAMRDTVEFARPQDASTGGGDINALLRQLLDRVDALAPAQDSAPTPTLRAAR